MPTFFKYSRTPLISLHLSSLRTLHSRYSTTTKEISLHDSINRNWLSHISMPKLTQLLGMRNRDESQGRSEKDTDYLARMVRENANRQNFSALTFRFCYQLALDLSTAELARTIAASEYPGTPLHRYSELELSAASVYMASHVRGAPKTLTEVARLTKVGSDTIHALYTELYLAQQRLRDADWHDIFGGPRHLPAVEVRRTLTFPPLKSFGRPT